MKDHTGLKHRERVSILDILRQLPPVIFGQQRKGSDGREALRLFIL
jgi:hypothetical protein